MQMFWVGFFDAQSTLMLMASIEWIMDLPSTCTTFKFWQFYKSLVTSPFIGGHGFLCVNGHGFEP
jgi:hypothetical protein